MHDLLFLILHKVNPNYDFIATFTFCFVKKRKAHLTEPIKFCMHDAPVHGACNFKLLRWSPSYFGIAFCLSYWSIYFFRSYSRRTHTIRWVDLFLARFSLHCCNDFCFILSSRLRLYLNQWCSTDRKRIGWYWLCVLYSQSFQKFSRSLNAPCTQAMNNAFNRCCMLVVLIILRCCTQLPVSSAPPACVWFTYLLAGVYA